jgi:hypothetical protein
VSAGWLLTVRGAQADAVELEQLDEAALDWFATGPGGDAAGTLAEVLPAAVAADSDPESIMRHGRDWRRMAGGGIAGHRGWVAGRVPVRRVRLVAKDLDRRR